jgi:NAD(P)-dependent dehydrogenase (short-subunit alcohol dehydrogenase family)
MATPFELTVDGFERQFGTNHLGHFVLVNRIAHLIKDDGRLVSLASSGHRYSDVDLDDPNFERTEYDPFIAYGRSKTANILFAVEFDRRHKNRGVRATSVHPGGIETELVGDARRHGADAGAIEVGDHRERHHEGNDAVARVRRTRWFVQEVPLRGHSTNDAAVFPAPR